jgi:hypothetical protein
MNLANQRQHQSSDVDLNSGIKDDRKNTLYQGFFNNRVPSSSAKKSAGLFMDSGGF